ncbi:MAG: hypothetical protein GY936_13220 [Ignavibacteriae bacterium]|nr:hypothetical protein [Ignavibacteriota bacterium]
MKIEIFVIGATAIDVMFAQLYNIKIHRVTNDIDFSVRVKDWGNYSLLIEKLKEHGFSPSNIIHRFNYKSIPSIDIIPFGKISLPKYSIKWPTKDPKEMSVSGYEECYNDSALVRISESPKLDVKISSPRGLVLLKLISWKDAYPSRPRDATDIFYIMHNYIEAGNQDRLFNEHNDLLDENFDNELTGATLLGRDIAAFANPTTLEYITTLLSQETANPSESDFINDMSKGDYSILTHDKLFDHCVTLVQNLLLGLISIKKI